VTVAFLRRVQIFLLTYLLTYNGDRHILVHYNGTATIQYCDMLIKMIYRVAQKSKLLTQYNSLLF